MTRLSQLLLPTEREPPADAEALSHKLMVRAGLVRQVGAFGSPATAAASFHRLADGLDLPIARVVAAREAQLSARAVIDACAPAA